ncbi:MAG: cytochrome c3 family protein [Coriobacteriales bacterium]|jgi:hypothetical protein|nr:cytochrome c3 family protein [Coriobacteriales bacterium]
MNSITRKTLVTGMGLATVILTIVLGVVATGCAPRGAEPTADAASQDASQPADDEALSATPIAWSMQSDCGACHTTEADNVDAAKYPQAAAHASTTGTACVDCHTNTAVLTTTHEGVTLADKPATKVTQLTVEEQTCIECHGTLEEVAVLTASSEALKDDQGTVVNPHQRPEGATHAENPASCTSCHNNHSSDLPKDAKKYCAQCHHRGIWQCGTCHEKR